MKKRYALVEIMPDEDGNCSDECPHYDACTFSLRYNGNVCRAAEISLDPEVVELAKVLTASNEREIDRGGYSPNDVSDLCKALLAINAKLGKACVAIVTVADKIEAT